MVTAARSTTTPAVRSIGTCQRCGTTITVARTTGFTVCPTCWTDPEWHAEKAAFLAEHPQGFVGQPMVKVTKVSGRVTKAECDAECQSAKSARCACQCGGAHHGSAWVR